MVWQTISILTALSLSVQSDALNKEWNRGVWHCLSLASKQAGMLACLQPPSSHLPCAMVMLQSHLSYMEVEQQDIHQSCQIDQARHTSSPLPPLQGSIEERTMELASTAAVRQHRGCHGVGTLRGDGYKLWLDNLQQLLLDYDLPPAAPTPAAAGEAGGNRPASGQAGRAAGTGAAAAGCSRGDEGEGERVEGGRFTAAGAAGAEDWGRLRRAMQFDEDGNAAGVDGGQQRPAKQQRREGAEARMPAGDQGAAVGDARINVSVHLSVSAGLVMQRYKNVIVWQGFPCLHVNR